MSVKIVIKRIIIIICFFGIIKIYLFYMNLYLFDFDDTLIKLPYKEHTSYMETKESLNDEQHVFELINETKADYENISKDENGLKILLSNRDNCVKEPLKKLLGKLGLEFDDHLLIDGENRSKADRILPLIKKHPIKKIFFWEDKDKHIKDVREKLGDLPIELNIFKTST